MSLTPGWTLEVERRGPLRWEWFAFDKLSAVSASGEEITRKRAERSAREWMRNSAAGRADMK